jgi:hypothetical protein
MRLMNIALAAAALCALPSVAGAAVIDSVGETIKSVSFSNAPANDAFEITNFTVAAVPEPGTWGMMLVGLGMVAGASRYRRRNTKTVYA